jgi:hypothetical protein
MSNTILIGLVLGAAVAASLIPGVQAVMARTSTVQEPSDEASDSEWPLEKPPVDPGERNELVCGLCSHDAIAYQTMGTCDSASYPREMKSCWSKAIFVLSDFSLSRNDHWSGLYRMVPFAKRTFRRRIGP